MTHSKTQRITLTLPAACLEAAKRIARRRRLTISAVVGEALQRGLRKEEQARRSDAILRAYSKAFAGFSAAELQLLDGVAISPRI